MASLLHDVELDWGWPHLDAAERLIARRHEALLAADRRAHTIESAHAALLAAARELPGRTIRARAIDDERTYSWCVVDGEIRDADDFDEAGMFAGELTAADFRAAGVTIVSTPIVVPDSLMRSIQERARQRDATLSELVQGAWRRAADELPPGFRVPAGPRRVQSIYLPVEIWADLHARAKAEEHSVSYLVQRALTAAYQLPVV